MKKTQDPNQPQFAEALKLVAESKNISEETVISLLQEALIKAYTKYLGGGDDADVRCDIDPETGAINLRQVKRVVKDVEDDYLEIDVEEANENLPKKAKKYVVGDDYEIPAPVNELSKMTANACKNILSQKIREAERGVLYEIYKDRIGEMITGTVEKMDERSVLVNIGKTNVELSRRQMIGDETYKIGDQIKVYLQEVKSNNQQEDVPGKKRGPQIDITRASEGFLKRIFEEEIHEIYDGTVVIKKIAREAGVRSKVAVISTNEDVDATGACIGQNGSRIQKVVAQLGNDKNKEKIDVINYSDEPAVFIIEALRPANVIGVAITGETNDRGQPMATAIIRDGQLSIAIGRKASNAKLASKITGYSIDIKEEKDAIELGIEYTSKEEWEAIAASKRREKEKAATLAKLQEENLRRQEEAKAKAEAEIAKPVVEEKQIVLPPEAANPAAEALKIQKELEAKAKEKAEAKEKAKASEKAEVKTTVSLTDLEKELEAAKEKKSQPVKAKKPRNITTQEVSRLEPVVAPAKPAMSIYTEEELKAIAEEEEEADNYDLDYDDDDIDYEDDYEGLYDEGR